MDRSVLGPPETDRLHLPVTVLPDRVGAMKISDHEFHLRNLCREAAAYYIPDAIDDELVIRIIERVHALGIELRKIDEIAASVGSVPKDTKNKV